MPRKRKLDYIIKQSQDERLVFRFYPRRSHCHSFNEEPPKSWEEVYKVYYSYAIIKQWKFDSNEQWESEVVFEESCDECSIIDEIAERCLLLANGYEIFEREDGERISLLDEEVFPFGMGTSWTISKIERHDYDGSVKHISYAFILFDYFGKGFRFVIEQKNILSFGEYLKECCEYMLAHGEEI